jgi:hypothetical protein
VEKFETNFFGNSRFLILRDAAFCYNSSGFLAAPYAGCDSSGILRRADRRVILEARRYDGVSKLFTLDACRHGGMTELEEAELTDGQGRALSGHKTAQAYRGYAKETMVRALATTRKRHAHLLAQKEIDQQNADGAASPRYEMQQTSPRSKTSVGSQR